MRWIIGDIHGMYKPLVKLVDMVHREDSDAEFLFAGDYVNRGPQSKQTIDFLLTLDHARFIRGNHDDVFDLILHGKSYAPQGSVTDSVIAFQWFMEHGLDQTLMSYGVNEMTLRDIQERPTPQRLAKILDAVPEEHRRFIRHLPAVIEFTDFFVLHGWWSVKDQTENPSLSQRLAKRSTTRQSVIWGRFSEDEIYGSKSWGRTGYFGHTAVTNYGAVMLSGEILPIRGPKIVLLDTGCALSTSGRLTAFCAETQTFLQVDHFANPVEQM
jgi:hypothetical protein